MLRSLIKLGLILVAGILVYNYFFGTPEEKAQSKEIFTGVKDLTKSAFNLLKSEKEKFEEGKYDEAVDKIGGLIDNLKGKAEQLENNKELLDQLAELQQEQDKLESKIQNAGPQEYGNTGERIISDSTKRNEIEDEWQDLVQKTERVMREMDRRAEGQ